MTNPSGNGEGALLAPDEIDESYAPRLVDGVLDVAVAGERVVIGGPWGGAQVLNPTAALVWQFLDGEATLGELIDDFSDATETPRDVVQHDILDFARTLGRRGFLVGVAEPVEEPEVAYEPPPPVTFEVGSEMEPFAAADLDGTERALTEFRGRRVYLVNWNPGCGYCDAIAETLADLELALGDAGVDLVLVAGGDAESNRQLVERAKLRAPVLLPGADVQPFHGIGTPAALELDADGRVAAELAPGALEVPKRAAELAGVELPAAPLPGEDARPGVRYLPAAGGMCGPGAVSGPKTTWAGTLALTFGEIHVGIRYNTDATAALLEKLFPDARIDDAGVPDNYSVSLTEPGQSSKELELLVQGAQQLVRSRSKKRVLVALLNYLSGSLNEPSPKHLRVVATPAVDRDGRALLLPTGLTSMIAKLQPRLAKRGISLVDTPFTLLDTETTELVVPAPTIAHDPTVLEELDGDVRLGRTELPLVAAGRYPLANWYVYATDPDDDSWHDNGSSGAMRPALAVAATITQVFTDDIETTVADLVGLVDRIAVRPVHYSSAAELADAL